MEHLQGKTEGAIHLGKNSEIFSLEYNGTVFSGTFISEILVNLLKLTIFSKMSELPGIFCSIWRLEISEIQTGIFVQRDRVQSYLLRRPTAPGNFPVARTKKSCSNHFTLLWKARFIL